MPMPGTGQEISFGRVYKALTGQAINTAGDADPVNASPKLGSQNIKLSAILGGYNYTAGVLASISTGTQISFSQTFGGDPDPFTY